MEHQLSQYKAFLDRQLASSSPAPNNSRAQDNRPRPVTRELTYDDCTSFTTPCTVRILYTLDLRGDQQYLAKLQHAIPTQTVVLPDGARLGTIDLRTCLKAVLKASPEVYSDDTDYTVYAFDPSEQGTPRVGYGRLKGIVQANGSVDQDQIMVTGIVKNNIAYLATSPQVKDNLEVRLSLTPVQIRGQTDSGSLSPFLQERPVSPRISGFPEGENSLRLDKLNPQLLLLLQQAANSQMNNSNQDALQRFMSHDHQNSQPSTSGNFNSFPPPLQQARPPSPAVSIGSNASGRSRKNLKRNASNMSSSNLPDLPSTLSQADGGYVSGEEAPVRKRARVTTAGRPSKTVVNKKSDLRVAASGAASVRVYQPTAVRPTFHTSQSIEQPPRAPTPVPQGNNIPQRRTSFARPGLGLRGEVSFAGSSYSESNYASLPNSSATSPDAISNTAGSPVEMGSSPPLIPGADGYPSSPALPPLPIHDDSGFMSGGGFNDLSETENEHQEGRSLAATSMKPPAKRQKLNNIVFQETQVLQNSPPSFQAPTALSAARARNAVGLKKSVTPVSPEVLLVQESNKRPRGRPNKITEDKRPSWDKEKRRQAMVAKLYSSVANGEIPPYCHNCGVIETPTWRRAFTKIHTGEPPAVIIPKGGVKEDGGIIGVEIVQQNLETGKNELFRIYKKNLLQTDAGFDAISLCNRKSRFLYLAMIYILISS